MFDLGRYVRVDERSPRDVAPRCPWPAAANEGVTGYETLQFSWGGLFDAEVPEAAPWCDTHLVRSTADGTPGPALCGLDRFDRGASPGWSVAGGLSGPGVPVRRCEGCHGARLPGLPVTGLNAEVFA